MPLSNPIINFQIKSAVQKELNKAQKILVFGQLTAAGTATPSVVINDIGDDYETLLGADSMAATTVRAINRATSLINENIRVDVLPLEDGTAAVAAIGDVEYATGPATESGTLALSIGSFLNNYYEISVADTDTVTAIALAFETVINADSTALVTASAALGVLTLTAVNKGVEGNFINIETFGSVAGIGDTITAMVGGTGEPDDITDKSAFAAISSEIRYQGFVYPQTYAVSTSYAGLQEFLDARFPANNRILDGNAFITNTDTLANLKTLATAVNNKSITLVGNKPTATVTLTGSAINEMDYVVSAYFAAVRALRLTKGAQIGPYIVGASGSLDDTGGMALASLPYMNTPFTNLIPPADINNFWTDAEVAELLAGGISVIGNNDANNDVIAGQIVTTYLTNALAVPDPTFRFLNYFDTLVTIREYFVNNLKVRFAQSRLVEGEIVPLRNDANRKTIIGYLLNLYQDLGNMALVETGLAATKFFATNLIVTVTKSTGIVSVLMLVSPVVQLRTVDVTMQVVFEVNL